MWSEHCSYKSSRVHLARLPTKGPRVIQGPGENAGVVDIGDGFAAVFKMESHNHPSFIEPYQGAATGVGGILRDVFTMGARPDRRASTRCASAGPIIRARRSSCAASSPASAATATAIGVPTVGGEVQFDAAYDGNILVNAFTCGVARTDRIFYGRAGGHRQPRSSTSAPRPGATASTARPWRPTSSPPSEARAQAARRCRSAIPSWRSSSSRRASSSSPRTCSRASRTWAPPGSRRRRVEMAGARGQRARARSRPRSRAARSRLTPYEMLSQRIAGAHAPRRQAGQRGRGLRDLQEVGSRRGGHRPRHRHRALGRHARRPATIRSTDAPTSASSAIVRLRHCRSTSSPTQRPNYDRPRSDDPRCRLAAPSTPHDSRRRAILRGRAPRAASARRTSDRARWIWRQYDHIVRGGTVVRPGSRRRRRARAVRDATARRSTSTSRSPSTATVATCELDPFAGRGDGGRRGVPQPRRASAPSRSASPTA